VKGQGGKEVPRPHAGQKVRKNWQNGSITGKWAEIPELTYRTTLENKMLSYCRETALQGAIVLAKSVRLELVKQWNFFKLVHNWRGCNPQYTTAYFFSPLCIYSANKDGERYGRYTSRGAHHDLWNRLTDVPLVDIR